MTGPGADGATRLDAFLSQRGRTARMPEGIRVWGERARRAGGVNATLGVIAASTRASDGDVAWEIARLPEVREAYRAWEPNAVFPYAPVAGVPGFRDGWLRWIAGKAAGGEFGGTADSWSTRLTRPMATCGVTGALAAVSYLVLDPGEAAIVSDRRWDGYDTTLGTVAGVRLEPARLLDGSSWDVEAWGETMRRIATTQSRVVAVVNFPHNPTGYVPTDGELDAFADTAVEVAESSGSPVVIVCDDAYEGFVWSEERPRWSIFYRLVDRHPRVLPVKCDGITKELLFWGGRLGAVTTAFPAAWDEEERMASGARWESGVAAVVRGMVSSASTPVQNLVARLLEDPVALDASRRPVLDSLAERHAAIREALDAAAARAAFRPDPFHGGLFAFLNLRRGSAFEAARRLLDRRIGVVPFEDPALEVNALRVTYATVPLTEIRDLISSAASVVSEL